MASKGSTHVDGTDHLVRRGLFGTDDAKAAVQQCEALMSEIRLEMFEPLPGGKPGQLRVKPAEWPNPAFVDVGIRGDLSEFDDARFADIEDFGDRLEERKFIDVVAAVMHRRMETDPGVVVMGEDVHRLNGGTNGATRGLKDDFPTGCSVRPSARTRSPASVAASPSTADSPRSSNSCTPTSCGWRRTVVQPDRQGASHVRRRGRRAHGAAEQDRDGTGYGSQHSMDPAGILTTNPGWRVVAPSTPLDYVGLMNSALRCKDPVVVLEQSTLRLHRSRGRRRPRLLPAR